MSDTMAHQLKRVETAAEWEAYHSIRERVLWEARGRVGYDRSHPDELNPENHPFLLLHGSDPVGVIRVDVEPPVAWFRKVAVRAELQGRGHGRVLLGFAQEFARRQGCRQVRSNVDPNALGFFLKAQFARLAVAGSGVAVVPMEKAL